MNTKAGSTIYSARGGVEITQLTKQEEDERGRYEHGRVALRFFQYATPAQQDNVRFILEPWECVTAHRKIQKVFADGGTETMKHSFDAGGGNEVITTLGIERWGAGDKVGYALTVKRGEKYINVPMDVDRFLYLGELLKYLGMVQSFSGFETKLSAAGGRQ